MEILIAQRLCGKAEDDTAVRADYLFGILAVTAEIHKIASAPYCLHERIEHHHGLGADAASVLIDGTAVSAGVLITYLLAVAAVMFGVITPNITAATARR